jgi:hypothetical protein
MRGWTAGVVLLLGAACGPSLGGHAGETGGSSTSASSGDDTDPTTASSVGTTNDPATTSPSTTMTSADGSDDSGLFTQPWDLDPIITGCSIWERDCPPGMKCMPYANDGGSVWNDTICSRIADDPRQAGEPCSAWNDSPTSGVDDCDIHMMCWDVDPKTLDGTCVEFCTGSPENPSCTDPATSCVQSSDGPLSLCLARCHPLDDPCPRGETCVPANDTFMCAPLGTDPHALGESCEFVNECAAGLFCAFGESVPDCASEACCAAFCNTTDADACGPDLTCTPWWRPGDAPPGYEELGACANP